MKSGHVKRWGKIGRSTMGVILETKKKQEK